MEISGELEEENIALGLSWIEKTKTDYSKFDFWKIAHKKHFSNVWSWAGDTRNEPLNNPDFSEPGAISRDLFVLEKNIEIWLGNSTYEPKRIFSSVSFEVNYYSSFF